MERDQTLLVKILEICIEDFEFWNIDLSTEDISRRLTSDQLSQWSEVFIDGHIELLVDLACINVIGEAPNMRIQRVTNAGYNYLERSKRWVLRNKDLSIH